MNPFSFVPSILRRIPNRYPLVLYAVTWTILLTVTVGFASFSPEFAFVSAISHSSSFARECEYIDVIRVPLDLPGELFCLPAWMFRKSNLDYFVPPIFAAVVVAGSAIVVSALGLWEDDRIDF
ncbi:hypothetical protein GIB67_040449 [Kingdonia uniflora]|uniref:Uncharacterized protein n=1 Tax=Kingdonia uniflora TaxID=39325 RepID=A0A7J7L521_9MAGN|nr:hypothetical protein GIB67_040449 [Kingdonia uniflora]